MGVECTMKFLGNNCLTLYCCTGMVVWHMKAYYAPVWIVLTEVSK